MSLFTKNTKIAGWMAIDIQDDGIRAAYVTRSPSSAPVVEQAVFYPCEQAAYAETLVALSKEMHANRFRCTNLLSSNEYQMLSVEAPTVPREELKTAIRWRLKDMIDFPVEDATVDVLDIPVDKNSPVRNRSVHVVAARNNLIEKRQAQFSAAKIPLVAIDIPEMAQRNVASFLEPENRGVAMLSFDANGGLLTVTFGGELYLSRRLDVNLTQLRQTDEEQMHALFDRITLELQRSLDHFDRQFHFITLAKFFLSPIGRGGTALQAHLAANLYVPVEILNLETVFDLSKAEMLKASDTQQLFFKVLGAALRDEESAS